MFRASFGAACVIAGVASMCSSNPFGPAPPPGGKDGVGTELGQVCGVLRAVGCPEGCPGGCDSGRTCYESLVVASRTIPLPVECLLDASNAASVRTCGTPGVTSSVRCAP